MAIVLRPEAPAAVGYDVLVVPRIDAQSGEQYFIASHPELPGCQAHGDNVDEALENLDDARELYLAMAAEAGRKLPEPHANPQQDVTSATTGPSESTTGAHALTVSPNWSGPWSPVPVTRGR